MRVQVVGRKLLKSALEYYAMTIELQQSHTPANELGTNHMVPFLRQAKRGPSSRQSRPGSALPAASPRKRPGSATVLRTGSGQPVVPDGVAAEPPVRLEMMQTHQHHARQAEQALVIMAMSAAESDLGELTAALDGYAECQKVSRRWLAETGLSPPDPLDIEMKFIKEQLVASQPLRVGLVTTTTPVRA